MEEILKVGSALVIALWFIMLFKTPFRKIDKYLSKKVSRNRRGAVMNLMASVLCFVGFRVGFLVLDLLVNGWRWR
ncbi:MAG: hypothetical protein ACRCX7_09960 [Cetobacterium sp.]|uniref:hypothetical protein n=1 Tax=Cetobacterium sp. TaxID=2071632 RepID=UPI003F2B9329